MLNVPITVNGIHTIFTETGENDSIQRHPITPPTRSVRLRMGRSMATRFRYGSTHGDGAIGLIDWGTVSRGPLLFDVALAVHAAQRAGHVDLAELFAPYLARAPVRPAELDGLRYYEALMWARSAKYFDYRLQHQILLGDPRPPANAERLARALAALKRFIRE